VDAVESWIEAAQVVDIGAEHTQPLLSGHEHDDGTVDHVVRPAGPAKLADGPGDGVVERDDLTLR